MMLSRILSVLRGDPSKDITEAVTEHRRVVQKSINESHRSKDIVRDIRANTKSATETLLESWDHVVK